MTDPIQPTTSSSAPSTGTTRGTPRRSGVAKATDRAKSTLGAAYEKGSATVRKGVDQVGERAGTLYESSAAALEGNPMAALIGAAAVGAAAAAIIPTSDREIDTMGPVGERLRGMVDGAIQTAKAAGIDHLAANGFTAASATNGLGGIIGGVVKAVLAHAEQDSSTGASTNPDSSPATQAS